MKLLIVSAVALSLCCSVAFAAEQQLPENIQQQHVKSEGSPDEDDPDEFPPIVEESKWPPNWPQLPEGWPSLPPLFPRPSTTTKKPVDEVPVTTAAPPAQPNATQAPSEGTTYDWGQHTGSTYDWGQHTSTQAPNQNSTAASNGTTYDWGQHTGSTYDWGQHTSTQSPNQNSTSGPSEGTTYDWGQHTGSTFDWGKYTSTTQKPNHNSTGGPSQGTTYDWGQHTGSTYDWGQHTSTQSPNHNGTDNGHNNGTDNGQNNNGTDNGQQDNPCGPGGYACSGAIGLCIPLRKICNGVIDCPHADDEEVRVCHPNHVQGGQSGGSNFLNTNRFRGQGFMFHIRNIKVAGGSRVKLFNQYSDNNKQKAA